MENLKTWRGRNGARYTYDPATEIITLEFDKRETAFWISNEGDMRRHFQDVQQFWRENCEGKKVYWLLNYDNFSVNHEVLPGYIEHLRDVMAETAHAAVRYGGSFDQRSVSRFTNQKAHLNANICKTREEALQYIGELKAGVRRADG